MSTQNLVQQAAAVQALFLHMAVNPPRGQVYADLDDREWLAWTALGMIAEQRGGHLRSRHLLRAAALVSLSDAETLRIATVLRDTLLEASS